MFVRDFNNCKEFIGGDGSILREFLHPDKDKLALGYSLAHAIVKTGTSTKPHRLKSSEVYYILKGKGLMHINNESAAVYENSVVYIEPDSVQYIENDGDTDLEFLCIVDPAWRSQDEEVL
jgi:mannose-6-phosphate isomerase-like protein (cupin superfamily)